MAITLSATFANALLAHDGVAGQSAVADQLGGGSLVIYDGTEPTGANEALSGNTVIATWAIAAATAFAAPSGGSLTLDIPTPSVTASATGNPVTFFRLLSSGGTSLIQGSVGTSGADFNLSGVAITSGDNVTISGTPTIALPVT